MDEQEMLDRLDAVPNIATAFFEIAERFPDSEVYAQPEVIPDDSPDVPRVWYARNYAEVKERVKKIAHFLKASGVRPGDKVAILSSSRPEWMEADIAVLALGGVTVSVYQSLPADDVGYILFDSGAEVVFAENQEQVDKLIELLQGPIHIPGTEDRNESKAQIGIKKIIPFEQVQAHELQMSSITGK